MKKYLLITAALITFAAPAHAESGLRDGFWAVDGVNNCKVPNKIYALTIQGGKIQFENLATGSLDIEAIIAAGDHATMTETVRSVRANGHGHAVGTRWDYYDVTKDLVNVERDGKTAYWIVRCEQ